MGSQPDQPKADSSSAARADAVVAEVSTSVAVALWEAPLRFLSASLEEAAGLVAVPQERCSRSASRREEVEVPAHLGWAAARF